MRSPTLCVHKLGRGGPGRRGFLYYLEKREWCEFWGRHRSSEWIGSCVPLVTGARWPSLQGCLARPPLCSPGACSSGKCEMAEFTTQNRQNLLPWFWGRGFGMGLGANPRDPNPQSCPCEGLPAIHTSTGSVFLPGPRCSKEGKFLRGQSRKLVFEHRAVCRLIAEFGVLPRCGETLIEMWERVVGRNREKMPKKNGLFRKCAGRSWKLFPFLPMFRLLLYFIRFIWS